MKHLLAVTGLSYYSDENLMYMAIATFFACGIAGWFTDTLLRSTGFGVVFNGLLMAGCLLGGLFAYSVYFRQIRQENPVTVILVGVGSAFLGLLVLVVLKKVLFRRF